MPLKRPIRAAGSLDDDSPNRLIATAPLRDRLNFASSYRNFVRPVALSVLRSDCRLRCEPGGPRRTFRTPPPRQLAFQREIIGFVRLGSAFPSLIFAHPLLSRVRQVLALFLRILLYPALPFQNLFLYLIRIRQAMQPSQPIISQEMTIFNILPGKQKRLRRPCTPEEALRRRYR